MVRAHSSGRARTTCPSFGYSAGRWTDPAHDRRRQVTVGAGLRPFLRIPRHIPDRDAGDGTGMVVAEADLSDAERATVHSVTSSDDARRSPLRAALVGEEKSPQHVGGERRMGGQISGRGVRRQPPDLQSGWIGRHHRWHRGSAPELMVYCRKHLPDDGSGRLSTSEVRASTRRRSPDISQAESAACEIR